MHFPLQKHYTTQATLFFFKCVILKSAKITDFRSFTCLQNYLLSYTSFSKSSKNYMFPNWILQEFLSWPFFPVLLGCDHLYHVTKTMKWEQSQHRIHRSNSLILFLWIACERNQLPPSPGKKSTLKKFPGVYLITHHCIQNPKRIKGDSTSSLLENGFGFFFPLRAYF